MARRPDPRSSRRPNAADPVNKFASSPQTASRRAASFRRRAAADALLLSSPADAPWAERFVERYEIHRELNAAERAGRRGRAGRGDRLIPQADPAAAEERRQFVERARDTAARVDARFRIGFRWFGGYVSCKPGRGGRGYAAARRREASVETLAAAYRRLAAMTGGVPSRAAVALEAGFCVRTAERRWDEVMRAVALADAEPAVEVSTLAPLD